jgi:hypothetical protein
MRLKTLGAVVTVALAATIGSVSAADHTATTKATQFRALNGIKAVPMASAELKAVKGMDHHFTVTIPSTGEVDTHFTDQYQDSIGAGGKGENFISFVGADGVTRLVSPAYSGLSQACGNGVIDGPGFLC